MVGEYTDLQSFAEYLLLDEVAKDPDGYHRSTFMYREADVLNSDGQSVTPGKMYAGPLWDKNKSYANTHPSYSAFDGVDGWSYTMAGQAPWWWETLAASPDFQAAVQKAWEKGSATGGAFDSERVAEFITQQQDYLNSSGSYQRDYQMFLSGAKRAGSSGNLRRLASVRLGQGSAGLDERKYQHHHGEQLAPDPRTPRGGTPHAIQIKADAAFGRARFTMFGVLSPFWSAQPGA